MLRRVLICCVLAWCGAFGAARAEGQAPFDLAGPALEVTVTRGAATLPIAEVPNLAAGDTLQIKADLPPGQSARFVLVAAFLRGATNPPPTSWFHRIDTWDRKDSTLGVTVPVGAQQVLVFLAPQTGGDFATLVGAVRGRPGAFVRASQDLNQASLDRSRLNAFLAAVRQGGPDDTGRLKTVTPLLARSLTLKLNTDCFEKAPQLQVACLMEGQESLVLDDGHSASVVQALTSGNPADLALQLSATPQAGFGFYSPYVAAVMDIARLMDQFHTAQYQYIPALAEDAGPRMSLLLNTPPSFHAPLSVLVAALPAVGPPQAPPLTAVDPKAVYCAERTDLVLPIDGAPLAYSTDYAHDMRLRVTTVSGKTIELPVKADAEKGGFIADTKGVEPSEFGDEIDGQLHGAWGFTPFDGPSFRLESARPQPWRPVSGDDQALVVGRDDTLRLAGEAAACVEDVALKPASGPQTSLSWHADDPGEISVAVPLAGVAPGPVTLLVRQYGMADPDAVPLKTYAPSGRLDGIAFYGGDTTALLKGERLDQVTRVTLAGVAFQPGTLAAVHGVDELSLDMADPRGAEKLIPGQSVTAKIAFADGRTANLKTVVAAPRPRVALIAKTVAPRSADAPIDIRLTNADELREGAVMTFSLRAEQPGRFSGHETIEVASAADSATPAELTTASGLTLEDAEVALATLDTGKAFGGSVFGPLRYRIVDGDGVGAWQPLATLVRVPTLHDLACHGAGRPCQLSGTNLFLIDAVASDPAFTHAVKVQEGFPGYVLDVPHPVAGRLYLRLHDDPSVINEAAFPGARHAAAD